MKLNRNDRRVLDCLLDNSRMTNTEIASRLKITSQAVGRIRKRLEEHIISGYTLNLNYAKAGLQTFAIAIAKMTRKGLEEGEVEVERRLKNLPNLMNIYRIPYGGSTHILLYGFPSIEAFDSFFNDPASRKEFHDLIETQQLFTFSHHSILKEDPTALLRKILMENGENGVIRKKD